MQWDSWRQRLLVPSETDASFHLKQAKKQKNKQHLPSAVLIFVLGMCMCFKYSKNFRTALPKHLDTITKFKEYQRVCGQKHVPHLPLTPGFLPEATTISCALVLSYSTHVQIYKRVYLPSLHSRSLTIVYRTGSVSHASWFCSLFVIFFHLVLTPDWKYGGCHSFWRLHNIPLPWAHRYISAASYWWIVSSLLTFFV